MRGSPAPMQLIDGQPVFSATDLVGYLACEHLTALERGGAGRRSSSGRIATTASSTSSASAASSTRLATSPSCARRKRVIVTIERDDEAERGDRDPAPGGRDDRRHGGRRRRHLPGHLLRRPLARLRRLPAAGRVAGAAIGLGPVPLRGRRHEAGAAREGRRGAPDLLVRRAADERIQGVQPEQMQVVLGGSARETASLRVDDYMAYYRAAKRRFEAAVLGTDGAPAPPPLPAGRHLPGAGRALRRLPLGRALRPAAARRRPPLARRRDHRPAAQGARHARDRHGRAARDRADPVRPAARWHAAPPASSASASRPASRSQGRGLPKPIYELLLPGAG